MSEYPLDIKMRAWKAMQKMAPQFAVLRQTIPGPWLDCMEREFRAVLDDLELSLDLCEDCGQEITECEHGYSEYVAAKMAGELD